MRSPTFVALLTGVTCMAVLPAVAAAPAPTNTAPNTAPKPAGTLTNVAPSQAPAFKGPIRGGYVLTHEHPMNAMAFGGNYAFTGASNNFRNGIMDRGYTAECGGCKSMSGCDHGMVKGNFTASVFEALGGDMGPHRSHKGPIHDSNSHARYSTEWIKAAADANDPANASTRLKLMVAFAVENEAMCEQLYYENKGHGGPGGDGYPCSKGDSLDSLERQIAAMKAWAQENSSSMEIAYNAADARRIIGANKLAIVLGIESEYAFGAEDRTFDPITRLDRYYDLGVRTFYLAHKINSRLAGADIYRAKDTKPGKAVRATQAISGCFYYDDNVGPFPLQSGNHAYCDNTCGPNQLKGNKVADKCVSKLSEISETNMADYVMGRGDGDFDGFKVYPKPPGFLASGGTQAGGAKMVDGVERNNLGLSHDGERVVRQAMTKGMIVNIDHVSSITRVAMNTIATGEFGGYPLNALHNNPNAMLVANSTGKLDTPGRHEYDFDDEELRVVRDTGGFFGVRLGPFASKAYPASGVTTMCPTTATDTARILAYLLDLNLKVGYSLDYATTTEGVYSRTFAGCGQGLGADGLQTYGAETTEGLSHIGMMKHWHKELETVGLRSSYLSKLKDEGVEGFVAMWEKSESKSRVGRQIPRQTFPRQTSTTGSSSPGACTSDASCSAGQFCTAGIPDFKDNVCKPKNPHGTPCSTKRQCQSDRCAWGMCADADECRADSDCPSGNYCGDPIAGKAKCKALLDKGKACTKDAQCASNKCSLFFCK